MLVKIKIGNLTVKGIIVDKLYIRKVKKKIKGKVYEAIDKRVVVCIPNEMSEPPYVLIKVKDLKQIDKDTFEVIIDSEKKSS